MSETYNRLLERLKRLHLISSVEGLLGWDEQVNLPRNSASFRADQMAAMASLAHEAATDPVVGELLSELEARAESLNEDQAIVVREARKNFDRVTKLPAEFVAEKAHHSSAAYHAWTKARSERDYASYAPFIAKHLELARREAEYQGWGDRSYDYAIDLHDPGFTAAKIDALFSELKAGLVPLVRRIDEAAAGQGDSPFRGFPVDAQRTFLHEVTAKLGFDYDRGRIDVSPHPFCEGSGADVRMTTRFHEDEPLDSLFSSIHETGHGLYEQGLPMEHHHTALGQHAGMAMHESQSRMWENQVGRSRAFWTYFEPRFRELFGAQLGDVSSDKLYREINAVRPTLIRVDSDEVHYNLHIILRFEIEKALFAGELSVEDLPQVWNDQSEAMLGIRPQHDGEGVLQDVHWSGGAFGYFPSYCLGNMIAAQNWVAVRQQMPDLESDFAEGRFGRLLEWLQTQIHSQGSRTSALERVKTVTGESLSPQPLLAYLNERYGSLYC
ncbi:MAG: carboxypeptidase M32 [Synoicihabitans sp.]